jgi:hypothetical protein
LGGALDVFGGFMVISLDEGNPIITDKCMLKVYKYLLKMGFLTIKEESPFEEFD